MSWIAAVVVLVLLVGGALFSLAAAIGLNRLPDVYTRMHAASKAGTVGSGLLLLAVAFHAFEPHILARSLAGFFFIVLTAPVSAHLLAKTAHHMGYPMTARTVIDELKQTGS
jgi:multicomponent Na+:H+ antiporter subunit G